MPHPTRCEAVAASLRDALATTPALADGIPVSASVGIGFADAGQHLGPAIADADREVNHEKIDRRRRPEQRGIPRDVPALSR